MIGQTISHYRILEKLGEGGMGVVYRAHDTKLERIVALKFLPQYLNSDINEKERFYHEARAAASLMHPNVDVIYEIGEHDNTIFLVLEYVEGRTLKSIVEQDPSSLSVRKALDIAIQMCDGLNVAHEKGIVHRDIKSDNLMLTPKGQVKIMDFGLAKLKGATRITQAGSTVGTAAYMSPEQAQGEDVDQRSDIFSFGVVLYELLTAHLPFRGEHQAALLYSLVNDVPPPVARFNSEVSRELEQVVSKALAKDKEERYQHIDEVLADLRRERKNLEYARSGYVKASTLAPHDAGRKPGINALKNPTVRKFLIPSLAVAVLAAALFLFSPFKSPVGENRQSSITGNSLAVMYFEDIPDPEDKEHTGEMLSNLLITSLSQVKGLEVISRERLLDIQKDLGQTDAKFISASYANQIARRAGVTTMLIGSILREKPQLAVTTRLIDVQSGKIISSQQVNNFEPDRIFNLVDSLAILIQSNLRTTSPEPAEIKPVAEVATKSPEAYRAYLEGRELMNKVYFAEAVAAFSRAIEIDNNFAMAYYYLSLSQDNIGDVVAAQRSLERAVDLSDNTTPRERLQILATNYFRHNDLPRAIEAYNQLIGQYPHETNAYIQLAFVIEAGQMLQPQKAVEVIRRGLKVEPKGRPLWNILAYMLASQNKREEALDAVRDYINLAPAEPNPYDTQGDIYAWFQEYDSSRASYQKAIKLRGDFNSGYKLGLDAVLRGDYDNAGKYFRMSGYILPVIDAHRGHVQAAGKMLSELPDSLIDPLIRLPAGRLRIMINFAYETGQYAEMLRLARRLTAELKKNPTDKMYGRVYLAWALARNGKSSEAHMLLGEIQKDVNGVSPALQATADYAAALVSFEEGNDTRSLEGFRKTFGAFPPNHEPNIFYGIALLRNGRIGEAIEELQRLTQWPETIDHYVQAAIPGAALDWPIPAVRAHYWLGVAYEKQGKSAMALDEYKTFLSTWKDADFRSAEIDQAKANVQRLEGLSKR